MTSQPFSKMCTVVNTDITDKSQRIPLTQGQSIVYELSPCNLVNDNVGGGCYIRVSAQGMMNAAEMSETEANFDDSAVSMSSLGLYTLVCRVEVVLDLSPSTIIGELVQRVGVMLNYPNHTAPAILNWGDHQGTWANVYYWTNLVGPNPNPGWGTQAHYLTVQSSGTIQLADLGGHPINPQPIAITLENDLPGWRCI